MIATYNAKGNCLQEQPERAMPTRTVAEFKFESEEYFQCNREWAIYNAHISSLRTIICSPELKIAFKDFGNFEDGKAYRVIETSYGVVAVPIDPLKEQDEPTDEQLRREAEMRYVYLRSKYSISEWKDEDIVKLERAAYIAGRKKSLARIRELEDHLKHIFEMYADEWTGYAQEWTEKVLRINPPNK